MGANTIKCTTPDPCQDLSKCGSELWTSYGFDEKKNHDHFKNVCIHKAKIFMLKKTIIEKSLHILEDGVIDVQVGDITQVIG